MNGFTKVYNEFLDLALKFLNPSEFKILFYIYRKTIGWNKESDQLSFKKIGDDLGLSKRCVTYSVQSLEKQGWITITRDNPKKKLPYNTYAMSTLVQNLHQCNECTSEDFAPELVEKMHQFRSKLVQNLHPTKEKSLKKDLKKSPINLLDSYIPEEQEPCQEEEIGDDFKPKTKEEMEAYQTDLRGFIAWAEQALQCNYIRAEKFVTDYGLTCCLDAIDIVSPIWAKKEKERKPIESPTGYFITVCKGLLDDHGGEKY